MSISSVERMESSMNGTGPQSGRYRDMPHRSSNEILKTHSNFAVKLTETAVDFVQKLAAVEEQHSQQLHGVVKSFRKKTMESLKKDPLLTGSSYFKAWEAMLDESDRQARSHTDVSQRLITSVSLQLNELTSRKKNLMKKWYAFREVYMARVDKMEDNVQKVFREYQDQWSHYAESLEKKEGSVKNSVVLHSYNAHNDYVLSRVSFNCLHGEFYTKQIYDMLDELQAIQEDLVKGFKHCLKSRVEIQQDKSKDCTKNLSRLMDTIGAISPSSDIAHFVSGQNFQEKVYPPPKIEHKTPELPPPKLPDSPPVDLTPLPSGLQLVDLLHAPLINIQDDLKKNTFEVSASLDQLHKEYQSVKTLLDSYRENPALGDPNSLVEELLQIRNKVRMKETDLAMVRSKLAMFSVFSTNGINPPENEVYTLLEDCDTSTSNMNMPRKSSNILVVGRSHEFVEDERKFRIPVFCSYCDSILQPPISRGVKCKMCKLSVHTKCQAFIPYCSGQPTPKSVSKASVMISKVSAVKGTSPKTEHKKQKRFSWMQAKKSAASESSESIEDEDETMGGIYEVPPLPPPKSETTHTLLSDPSSAIAPNPPPRDASLDPKQGGREDELGNYSFEEMPDNIRYCVVLYDYKRVNSNDLQVAAGCVVELLNTSSNDWWKGTAGGRKGYFPASYVQLVSHGDVIMRAIYEFSASSYEEMSLDEGQIVVMSRCDGDGWMFGRSGESEGLFPENYVERLRGI